MPKRIIRIWPPQKLKPEEDAQLGREKIALVQTKYKISTWNLCLEIDICCLQETKLQGDYHPIELLSITGYTLDLEPDMTDNKQGLEST